MHIGLGGTQIHFDWGFSEYIGILTAAERFRSEYTRLTGGLVSRHEPLVGIGGWCTECHECVGMFQEPANILFRGLADHTVSLRIKEEVLPVFPERLVGCITAGAGPVTTLPEDQSASPELLLFVWPAIADVVIDTDEGIQQSVHNNLDILRKLIDERIAEMKRKGEL